jgi:hypothetical protein
MLAADISGLSVKYKEADGPKRYGQYDDVPRSKGEWQSVNIGHLEFSTLENLGEFGWKEFIENPITAKYLGWPLHALGDTIVPHHIYGTMSYGHAPFEDAIDDKWPEIYEGQETAIVEKGFEYWKKYCYNKEMNGVKELINEVAIENRGHIGSWAWQDWASIDYEYFRYTEDDMDERDAITYAAYTGQPDFIENVRPLLINSSGAALALMVCASEIVEPPGKSDDAYCPDGYGYCPTHSCDFQCVEGYTGPGSIETQDLNTTTTTDTVIVV